MAAVAAPTTQTGTKRKATAAGLPGNPRPVKRRASKACHCCRSRKVRCDVVESGIPCTNCRLDEVECVVTEGKRRKKSYVDGDILNHSPIESIEEQEEVQKFPLFDDIDGLQEFSLPAKPASHEIGSSQTLGSDGRHHRPHLIYQTQGQRMSPEERTRRISALGQAPRLSITPVQLPPHLQYHPPTASRAGLALPPFITPIPRHILAEDLEFLEKKGAFQLPDVAIRNELLRSYAQYVHPFLPILDLEDFLSTIDKNQSTNPISLLLYQAVMFAASAYIDMRHLTAQGFNSRKAARKVYFQRVKLLYDFDWELERVSVVQSVLLMTYWYESPNDPKDVWYWLGIAISIARTIGMNCRTDSTSILTAQKQKLWKRIWWCIYVRDRILAIGLRRPIRIRSEDYNVQMLELEDFETNALPSELCRILGGCSSLRDSSKRQTLANLYIALVKVCHLMTDVLDTQYTMLSHKIGVTSETTVRLVPRPSGAEAADVFRCDKELQAWYDSLSDELRYFKPGSRERTNNHDGEVICVHRALLTAIYLTTSSALHRPQMMPAMPDLLVAPDLKDLSQQRVHDGAVDTTEIYRDLYGHDLIRYLPNTGVTVLLPAIIIHLMDIKSLEGDEKQASMRHFQFCMQALQKLRDLYSSADFAFAFLDAAIKKTDFADKGTTKIMNQGLLSHAANNETGVADTKDSALTPPPELYHSTNTYVDQSVLPGSGREPFSAMTPPSPARTSSFNHNSGISISLKDLENFIGLDDTQHDEHDLSVLIPAALEGHSMIANNNVNYYTQAVSAAPATTHLFEHLNGMSSGSDLFAPNQVSIDDSLFKDIDMEWLADSNDDEDDSEDRGNNAVVSSKSDHVNDNSKLTSQDQLETPPDSAVELSRDGSLGTPDAKSPSRGSSISGVSPACVPDSVNIAKLEPTSNVARQIDMLEVQA